MTVSSTGTRLTGSQSGRRRLASCLLLIATQTAAAKLSVAAERSSQGVQPASFAATDAATQQFFSGSVDRYEEARTPPLSEYRIRIDDRIQFLFRTTKETAGTPYHLSPGDRLRISSATVPRLNRQFAVEPDGMVTVPMLGRFRAAGQTINALRDELLQKARADIREPDVALTAISIFSRLDEFQSAVSNLQAHGELSWFSKVSPDGTVQLPSIGSMTAAGLTLGELQREATARFDRAIQGVHVTVLLNQRAPSYVSVLGEVRVAGRFTLEKPTSISQSISLAGGWIPGADLSRVIVFRRDANWQLVATSLDLRQTLHGKSLAATGEVWLRDGDIVLLPKSSLRRFDDAVELVFTRGLYKLLPVDPSLNYLRFEGSAAEARDIAGQPQSTGN